MLGIIGAMDEEVARLKEMIDGLQVTDKCGMSFYKGQIEGTDVVVVKCGVGKVYPVADRHVWSVSYHQHRNSRITGC